MTTEHLTEAQMVNMVRNTLLVAGHEMGESGDHWPVVKSTIQSVMKDYENLQINRNVDAELKVHLATWLNNLETEIAKCPAHERAEMELGLKELREVYSAYFEDAKVETIHLEEEDIPVHIKRLEQIVSVLEGEK